MDRKEKCVLSFFVICWAIYKLVPLGLKAQYFQIPFGWGVNSLRFALILLTAILMQVAYTAGRKNRKENDTQLKRAISALLFPPFIGYLVGEALRFGFGATGWTKWIVLLGSIAGIVAFFCYQWLEQGELDSHKRGRRLLSYEEAKRRALEAVKENTQTIMWGFLSVPDQIATSHFSVTGATGSGKTILMRMLMQSVLPRIQPGNDQRALIYDAKQDMLSILKAICPEQRIILLNPFDERGAAWDMAADVTSPATAQQVASILIPEEKNTSQPFFADAARHLLAGVLISFIRHSPERWTFRDVIFTMKQAARLREVIARDESTSDLLEYFKNETTAQNIMSTVATKLQRYEFIAAAWTHAKEKVSLRDWIKDRSILVLGNDEATRTALDAINQVIFKRVTELVLDQSESTSRRTWFFLDEIREAGRLDGLGRLLTKGRSKGACVVLGYQDIEGLREVYGYQLAAEISGQCSNKAILRTDSPETARWGASLFGEQEVLESTHANSRTTGEDGKASDSYSTHKQIVKREVVLPSEIMSIGPTTRDYGLRGYYLTPSIGAYSLWAGGSWVEESLIEPDRNTPNLIRRADVAQYLKAWELVDLQRLALPSLDIERQAIKNDQAQAPLPGLGILEGINRD